MPLTPVGTGLGRAQLLQQLAQLLAIVDSRADGAVDLPAIHIFGFVIGNVAGLEADIGMLFEPGHHLGAMIEAGLDPGRVMVFAQHPAQISLGLCARVI